MGMEGNRRCEIIAEIGINHGGDMNRAKAMIEMATAAGADVAKFQLYKPEKILRPSWFTPADWAAILESELKQEQAWTLFEHCGKCGIEFLASAFDLERLHWLEEFEVKRHKIASRSVFDAEYVRAVKATGKPLLISMGWLLDAEGYGVDERLRGTYEECKAAVTVPMYALNSLLGGSAERTKLLYCVSKYPTVLSELRYFPRKYNVYDGFSDHTRGITAAKVAIARGARVVEKHFTLDPTAPGPDQECSMTPAELAQLVRFRDECQEIEGGS